MKTEFEYRSLPEFKAMIQERLNVLDDLALRLGEPNSSPVFQVIAAFKCELQRLLSGRRDSTSDAAALVESYDLAGHLLTLLRKLEPEMTIKMVNHPAENEAELIVKMAIQAREQFGSSLTNLELNLEAAGLTSTAA